MHGRCYVQSSLRQSSLNIGKEYSGLSPRDVFYLYHIAIIDARHLLTSEGAGCKHLLHEKDSTGFVMDYTGGKFKMDKFRLDDWMELKSGRRRVVRYPLCLADGELDSKSDNELGQFENEKEGTTRRVVLAVQYGFGNDTRTLFFYTTFK